MNWNIVTIAAGIAGSLYTAVRINDRRCRAVESVATSRGNASVAAAEHGQCIPQVPQAVAISNGNGNGWYGC